MSIPFIQLLGTVQRSDQSSRRPLSTVTLQLCVDCPLVCLGRRVKLPAESGD